jgi:PLP dependent protein
VTHITEKLAALRERVARAEIAAGRVPASVTIVAVSKTHPPEAIAAAHDAGQVDFAENYLQEAEAKITQLKDDIRWHFIGNLQSNKTRGVAERFHWVQTVASTRIAERLSAQRPYYAGELQVCIQLRPEPADGRGGVAGRELAALAAAVAGLPRLKLRGLLFMPHASLDGDALRREMRRARLAYDELCAAGHALDTLSMGISDDLEIAIAEGSTMVRVGTALFGRRPTAGAG